MAAVVASVASGKTVVPQLVTATGDNQLEAPSAAATEPLTAAEARSLRSMMRAVVARGSGTLLRSLQPPPVIAKTGTAEYGSPNGSGALPTHAWMIAAQGDLAVAVFVADGESGSHTAGPILESFLKAARGQF
jgi:cell division protein FtsI/penicillin-binding protein 2